MGIPGGAGQVVTFIWRANSFVKEWSLAADAFVSLCLSAEKCYAFRPRPLDLYDLLLFHLLT